MAKKNKKKKLKVTNMDRLKIAKKISRDTNIMPKPMITTNKKKKANKESCREFKFKDKYYLD